MTEPTTSTIIAEFEGEIGEKEANEIWRIKDARKTQGLQGPVTVVLKPRPGENTVTVAASLTGADHLLVPNGNLALEGDAIIIATNIAIPSGLVSKGRHNCMADLQEGITRKPSATTRFLEIVSKALEPYGINPAKSRVIEETLLRLAGVNEQTIQHLAGESTLPKGTKISLHKWKPPLEFEDDRPLTISFGSAKYDYPQDDTVDKVLGQFGQAINQTHAYLNSLDSESPATISDQKGGGQLKDGKPQYFTHHVTLSPAAETYPKLAEAITSYVEHMSKTGTGIKLLKEYEMASQQSETQRRFC